MSPTTAIILIALPFAFVTASPLLDQDCTTCPVDSARREFFRTATIVVAAALAGMGASARSAEALPVTATRGRRTGATVKYPIPSADSVQIDKTNELILIRWEGKVLACDLSCPHQNTSLRWSEADKRFICPKHKSNYTPLGGFIEGRATRGMDRHAIVRVAGDVSVDTEQLFKEDENAAEWKAAIITL